MYNPFTLKDKTILITGASSGIGAETAIHCSKMGGKLFITARNQERLDHTFAQLEGQGHEQCIADLVCENEIDHLVAHLPVLDGIVLNAGISSRKIIKFLKKEEIDRMFLTNFQAPVLMTQKLIAGKKLKKAASVVFISSIAASECTPGNCIYGATKGALNSFSGYLARELVPQRIRVNTVLPGIIKTPLLLDNDVSDEQWEIDEKKYLLGRFGVPEDVACLINYLLSDASQWMTGTFITIDGGYSLYK